MTEEKKVTVSNEDLKDEISMRDREEGGAVRLVKGQTAKVISFIALLMAAFQLYSAVLGPFTPMVQRGVHLAFVMALVFLLYPAKRGQTKDASIPWYDILLAILAVVTVGYVAVNYQAVAERLGATTPLEFWLGLGAILLLIEAVRRTVGWPLALIALVTIIYGLLGPYMPGLLIHRGYSVDRIVSHLYLAPQGIFGTPLGVSASVIVLFTIFGAFLSFTGVGQLFIDVAMGLFGRRRGGPAYAAVLSSALVGTVSGSAAANVVTTGTFTIPLMKKVGYNKNFAGAVESVASTGGQIMPPIMGAAAFIMADNLQLPYAQIAVAAAIPAILYYVALLFMVYFEAVKVNLAPMAISDIPNIKKTIIKGFHGVIPFVLFVYLLIRGYSPMFTAFWSLIFLIAVCMLRPSSRMKFSDNLVALEQGVRAILVVSIACAASGIVIGMLSLTGLGVKFSTVIVGFSGGNLILLLVLTMVASIVLGMGLPTAACYVLLAAVAAPAISKLGVLPLAAHMFVFYFGIISAITPPVALASYAACGISGGDINKTGFTALKLGFAGFIVPYMFIFGPQLLGLGAVPEVILALISSIIGVIALASGLQGFLISRCFMVERVLLVGAALLLIKPGMLTDVIGFVILVAIGLIQLFRKRKERTHYSQMSA